MSAMKFRARCLRTGRSLLTVMAGSLAVLLAGCDLGSRDRLDFDGGEDSGTDTDADTDADSGPPDAGLDASPDWRYADAGDTWDDGEATVDGPCDNDCEYVYGVDPLGEDDRYGTAVFSVAKQGVAAGQVAARETGWVSWFLNWSWSNMQRYRHRLLVDYRLHETTHDLISGEAMIYAQLCGTIKRLRYTFDYDAALDEFAYTVETGGRNWGRTLSSEQAPVIMFNYRNYPMATKGHNSMLFAYLIGERYDWTAGGPQSFTVFAPETERLETLVAWEGTAPDTLVIAFPDAEAWAPTGPSGWDANAITITYEYDIPVAMTGREYLEWKAVSATAPELNMTYEPPGTAVLAPAPLGGYATSDLSVTSGGIALAGFVHDPSATGPHPAVVMLPGWDHVTRNGEMGAVDLYSQLADRLAAAGYVVARTDNRGQGESDGALESATLEDLVDDGVATVAAVAAVTEVDASQVYLLAVGEGVHIAAGVASDAGTDVAGLILLGPIGQSYPDVAGDLAARYYTSASASDAYVNTMVLDREELFEDLEVGDYDGDLFEGHTVAAWQSLFAGDLVTEPVTLPPTLILLGAEDHELPAAIVDALATALSGASTPVTNTLLTGLSHGFTAGTAAGLWPEHSSMEAVDASAVDAITAWLSAQTGGK